MVKVDRSFPALASLAAEAKKKTGSYSEPDVVGRLRQDFHNKCYICELKDLQDPQVEHLLPHKNGAYPERKFDWNNLFWVCGHCNGVKNNGKYEEGIIDCCMQEPKNLLIFDFKEGNVEISVKNQEEHDERIERTAKLVQEVFNLKNTGIRVCASEMRLTELSKEMNKLYDSLERWKKNPGSAVLGRTLKAMLRRESGFAAFKREYIRKNGKHFPKLLQFCQTEE